MPEPSLRTLSRPGDEHIGYVVTPARRVRRHTLLLVHGLASNLTRWSEFVATTSLAETCTLIQTDLRGHERSPTRGRIGLDLWCDDLAALLDAEGAAPAICIGHSLGAQVALHFAARHPDRVAALALIDPVFRAALHGRMRWLVVARPLCIAAAAIVRALNAAGIRRRSLPPLDLRALDVVARDALRSPSSEAEFIARYSSMWADLRTCHTAHYLQDVAAMFAPLPRLEQIEQPALVVLSTGATFANVESMAAQARRLPRVHIATIACHHWPLTERPAEVRQAIENWVAAL